jgi:protein-L-isoaspartate O-methyltransferase
VPQQLVTQLARGGRMIIPVGPEGEPQQFLRVDRALDGVFVVVLERELLPDDDSVRACVCIMQD